MPNTGATPSPAIDHKLTDVLEQNALCIPKLDEPTILDAICESRHRPAYKSAGVVPPSTSAPTVSNASVSAMRNS